jgi:hypothetical protein
MDVFFYTCQFDWFDLFRLFFLGSQKSFFRQVSAYCVGSRVLTLTQPITFASPFMGFQFVIQTSSKMEGPPPHDGSDVNRWTRRPIKE